MTQTEQIIMLLALLLLQGIDQKGDNKCCFSKRKYWKLPHFGSLCERGLHLLLKFLSFVDNEGKMKPHVVPGNCVN
jgi:hypothetical protein